MISPTLKTAQARSFTLPNGFKVIYHDDPSNAVVSLQIVVRVGSIYETAGDSGYSHFIEHLTFKNTRHFPANSLTDYIQNHGGVINAFTDFDMTCYYILLPSEKMEVGLMALADIVTIERFSSADIATEKRIIIEEIRQYRQDPESEFIDYLQTRLFPSHPMQLPVLGSEKSIRSTQEADLWQHYSRYYTPKNCFLTITGDISGYEMETQISKYFTTWKPLQASPYKPDPEQYANPPLPTHTLFSRKHKLHYPKLAFMLPELSETQPLNEAQNILLRTFGAGKQSRLYNRLVIEEKLCTSIQLHSLTGIYSGFVIIEMNMSQTTDIIKTADCFKTEFDRMVSQGISETEFEATKLDLLYSWIYSTESMENYGANLASDELNGDYLQFYNYAQKINAVSSEDIRSALDKYWINSYVGTYYSAMELYPQNKTYLAKLFGKSALPSNSASPSKHINIKPLTFSMESSSESFTSIQPLSINLSDSDFLQATLANHTKVIIRKTAKKSICGFALTFKLAQEYEDSNHIGHNFFTTKSMVNASQDLPYEQLRSLLRQYGITLKLYHALDTTTIYGKCFSEFIEVTLRILADLFYHPRLDTTHLTLQKNKAINQIKHEKDNPETVSFNAWYRMLVGNKTNLNRPCGNLTDVRKVTQSALKFWHLNKVMSTIPTLCLVGDIDLNFGLDLCHKYFGFHHPLSNQSEPIPYYQSSLTNYSEKHVKGLEQSIIHIGGFGCKSSDMEQNTAFYVLSQILGGDISSRFFAILREKHGLAYHCGFDFTSTAHFGIWNAFVSGSRDEYRKIADQIHLILDDLLLHDVSETELNTAKQSLIGSHRFDGESVIHQATALSNLIALDYSLDFYLNREQRISEVTSATIRQLSNQWLQPANRFTHITR